MGGNRKIRNDRKNLIVDLSDRKFKDMIPWINYGNKFDN